MISLDTETVGRDFHHGSGQPFFVTVCSDEQEQRWWEWPVNPLTRRPIIPQADMDAVVEVVQSSDALVLQNAKFDVSALSSIIPDLMWPWDRTHDTLIAGHLLASNQRHDLTSMAMFYAGQDIQPWEDALQEACTQARRLCRSHLKDWMIAKEGLLEMPSAKSGGKGELDKLWKYDCWLPRSLAAVSKHPVPDEECNHVWPLVGPGCNWTCSSCGGHRWWVILREYSNWDSSVTVAIWQAMELELKRKNLWELYLHRMQLPDVILNMERKGVTVNGATLAVVRDDFREESDRLGKVCVNIAAGFKTNCERCEGIGVLEGEDSFGNFTSTECPDCRGIGARSLKLELPKGASPNNSLREVCFGWKGLTCDKCGFKLTEGKIKNGECDGSPCPKCQKRKKNKQNGKLVLTENRNLDLPRIIGAKSKTATPSLDKEVIAEYVTTLEPGTKQLAFVKAMAEKRGFDTSLSFMKSYERFWVKVQDLCPVCDGDEAGPDCICGGTGWLRDGKPAKYLPGFDEWHVLHPVLNQTGTVGLRMSCFNPNGQQVSKLERANLRQMFGPAPGREWWSKDASNIELRIPAYEAEEREVMDVFDHPERAPYYGSHHLLVFDTFWPDIFAQHGKTVKQLFESTNYQWVKNGTYARQYGAQERKVDATFHHAGADAALRDRFPRIAELSERQLTFANKHGYVETIPDKAVGAKRGYPLMTMRTEWGRVKPTLPLCYHVSGTACWWMGRAMVECEKQLRDWRREGFDGWMVMQVHDELVFDFPKHGDPVAENKRIKDASLRPNGTKQTTFRTSNLWRVRRLQELMERCGDGISVPTPVSVEYHPESWGVGISM